MKVCHYITAKQHSAAYFKKCKKLNGSRSVLNEQNVQCLNVEVEVLDGEGRKRWNLLLFSANQHLVVTVGDITAFQPIKNVLVV